MIIDNLNSLPTAPTTGDEFPVERGTTTYKVGFDAVANAVTNRNSPGIQRGKQAVTLTADSQTEVTITLPVSYQSATDYIVVCSVLAYALAEYFTVVVREQYAASFVVRVHNGASANVPASINWIAMSV